MKILDSKPPNFTEISRKFPELEKYKPIFCYGDAIYNPFGSLITKDLIAHESTHKEQQGNDPKTWWTRYLNDDRFRLEQETEAYARQFAFVKQHYTGKNELFLAHASVSLSSELYGNIVSENEARVRIKRKLKQVNIV